MAIESRLWKAAELALRSTFFPLMVRAACWVQKKQFTDALLYAVAATPAIVNAIVLEKDQSIDVPLVTLMQTNGSTLDKAIMDAVAAYVPPTT